MIPPFTLSGVLPPFDPSLGPTHKAGVSPYPTDTSELVATFATSPTRISILEDLISYRQDLRSLGITQGFQWIDGSFVEDVETTRGRPPKDLDLVTFAYRPASVSSEASWRTFVTTNGQKLQGVGRPLLHAFYFDLHLPPHYLVNIVSYWFGLFSHQRTTFLWKGMLLLDLSTSDSLAAAELKKIRSLVP